MSVRVPGCVSVNAHAPAATDAAHAPPPLADTVTVPVGVPDAAVTVNRTVTACPTSEGSGSSAVIAVVVAVGAAGPRTIRLDVTGA